MIIDATTGQNSVIAIDDKGNEADIDIVNYVIGSQIIGDVKLSNASSYLNMYSGNSSNAYLPRIIGNVTIPTGSDSLFQDGAIYGNITGTFKTETCKALATTTEVLNGVSYTKTYVITSHSNYTSAVTTTATCTTAGIKTYTCACKKHTYTEAIPATGHTWKTVTSSNYVDVHTCSVCGATGSHNWNGCGRCLSCLYNVCNVQWITDDDNTLEFKIVSEYYINAVMVVDCGGCCSHANMSSAENYTFEFDFNIPPYFTGLTNVNCIWINDGNETSELTMEFDKNEVGCYWCGETCCGLENDIDVYVQLEGSEEWIQVY